MCENRKRAHAQIVEIVENSNKFSRFPVEITDPGIAGSEYHRNRTHLIMLHLRQIVSLIAPADVDFQCRHSNQLVSVVEKCWYQIEH